MNCACCGRGCVYKTKGCMYKVDKQRDRGREREGGRGRVLLVDRERNFH